MISTALTFFLLLVLDGDHCARWVETPHGLVCGDVRLKARCFREGWHVVAQGVSVCVRGCGEEGPTT